MVLNRSSETDTEVSLAHIPQARSNNIGIEDNYFLKTLSATMWEL